MIEILKSDDEVERCGLVMQDGTLVEIENIADDPTNSFDMNPKAVLPLIQTGEVVGTWHTHPKSDPGYSGADHDFFLAWPDLKHTVIGIRDGKPHAIQYLVLNGFVIECE